MSERTTLLACVTALLSLYVPAAAQRLPVKRIIDVTPTGPGAIRTIQEALDAVSPSTASWTLIRLPAGVYREKVFITRSLVAIVSEGQERTRLEFPVLRSSWRAENGDMDWGAGVVNIGNGVENVVLANLSVRNTYGDSTGVHDHQFAIRGFDATRIVILHCSVSSAGGDALSLWNKRSGMYYHAYSSFEGWVDYVCPRGWCYITNSRFFGYNTASASLWHDGSTHEEQKFVIRRSSIDGVPGFPLGRHHRDAQFFLLDCLFGENMADRPLYAPDSPNTVPWRWGARHYFWNCSRVGGSFAWFSDNLANATGSPVEQQITPAWTFGGRWDPESTIPSVLPFASVPRPESGAEQISGDSVVLRWIPAIGATRQVLVLKPQDGHETSHVTGTDSFVVVDLRPGTTYQWRVDSTIDTIERTGITWTFTTLGKHKR